MKKVLSIILVLGLLIPTPLCAKKKPFGNGLFWEITADGTLVISGYGAMPDDDFSGKKRPWHSKLRKGIVHCVEIQEGITHIGDYAFYCGNFSSISLPKTLKSIGAQAFSRMKMKKLIIPSNVEYIGRGAFEYSDLEEVILSKSLKRIDCRTFGGCKLNEIEFPENVEYIGEHVVVGNFKLKSIIFTGHDVKEICRNAFLRDASLDNDPLLNREYEGTIYNAPSKLILNGPYYGLSRSVRHRSCDALKDEKGNIIVPAKKGRQVINVYDDRYKILCYEVFDDDYYKWGIMGKTGEWLIQPKYNKIEDFGSCYFRLTSGETSSIVFLDGNNVKTIMYSTSNYKNIGKYDNNIKGFPFTRKGCKGYIDLNGNEFSVTRVLPTEEEIKQNGGYNFLSAIYVGSKKMYKVKKGDYYGLTDEEGNQIVSPEMDDIDLLGGEFFKFKIGSFWGVMNSSGNITIPTSRGYTSIDRYIASQKIITYTKGDGKGECDVTGKQISFIANKPQGQAVSSSSQSSTSTSAKQREPQKRVTMVPMQVWQPCGGCNGSGQCSTCFGTGTNMSGNSWCISCHGNGKCHFCAGQGGQNVVQYVEKVEYY